MQQGYTGPEVCKITGISYRQLDHWTSTGLINASIRNIKGSGFHRLYSFNDIVLVKLVNKLRDAGISLQKIRVASGRAFCSSEAAFSLYNVSEGGGRLQRGGGLKRSQTIAHDDDFTTE